MERNLASKDVLIRVFFFGAFALIFYQLILLARPFFTAMLVAMMMALMFHPLHRRIVNLVGSKGFGAFLSSACVLLLAILPLVGLAWFFIREASDLVPTVQQVLEELKNHEWPTLQANLPDFLKRAAHSLNSVFDRLHVDFKQVVLDNAQVIGAKATSWGTQALRNILITLLNFIILAVSLFFAFRDGEHLLQWGLSLVPMQASHKQVLATRAYETFRAVVIGSFLTSTAQGAVAMLGFMVAGVKLPIVLGLATSMCSLLGGSFLVTVPVALSVMRESMPWGVFLFIWAVGVVGILDNFLKPILIGSRARMPFILIFFSIVGGIKLYGLLGFILGPVLIASFLAFVKIYRQEYNA